MCVRYNFNFDGENKNKVPFGSGSRFYAVPGNKRANQRELHIDPSVGVFVVCSC